MLRYSFQYVEPNYSTLSRVYLDLHLGKKMWQKSYCGFQDQIIKGIVAFALHFISLLDYLLLVYHEDT